MRRISENLNNDKSLTALSIWFVTDILHCNRMTDAISFVFLAAADKYQRETLPADLLPQDRFLFSELGPVKYATYKQLQSQRVGSPSEGNSTDSTMESSTTTASGTSTATSSGGLVVLPRNYPNMYASVKCVKQKLEVMCSAVFELGGQIQEGKKMKVGGKTCQSYRQLYQYKKIVTCLAVCFKGNKDLFLESNPKIALAKFVCCVEGKCTE
jgi:hypothetical protein